MVRTRLFFHNCPHVTNRQDRKGPLFIKPSFWSLMGASNTVTFRKWKSTIKPAILVFPLTPNLAVRRPPRNSWLLLEIFFHPSTLMDRLHQFTPALSPTTVLLPPWCLSMWHFYVHRLRLPSHFHWNTQSQVWFSLKKEDWSKATVKSRQQTLHTYQVTWKTKQPKSTRSLLLMDR